MNGRVKVQIYTIARLHFFAFIKRTKCTFQFQAQCLKAKILER